jgi:beta-alanine degradation protein BauB
MKIPLIRTSLAAAILLGGASVLTSQQASATRRVPQFENSDVNVWKSVVLPDAPLVMHTHEHPRVIIALQGGDMKIVTESGGSEMHHWDTGKAYWLSAEEGKTRHADVNAGKSPIEVMVVEVKGAR